FLRFCLPLTPDASVFFAPMMIAISVVSIIYGGLVALGQNDIKKLIAYSSVGHMGFVTLGIFLFNQRGVEGALFQMLNHGIVTGALFMMIGFVYERSHSREIKDNMGMGKYMPGFMFFWGMMALASFGFPGTNGFVGEILVFVGAFQVNPWLGACLVPGALVAAAYMFRVSLKMAWGQPSTAKDWKDLCSREWVCLTVPAVFVLYIGLGPSVFFKAIDPSVEKLLDDLNSRAKIEKVETENFLEIAASDIFGATTAQK
ncbi:MAG: NADH-quinone oxidoreductase subunit M, partial [Proteobacteria bacterium]|nr:NADH-quinone oxidoreductase subunit M [Pseudomonadota bacterium]